jgi:hypothetical protein
MTRDGRECHQKALSQPKKRYQRPVVLSGAVPNVENYRVRQGGQGDDPEQIGKMLAIALDGFLDDGDER